jgi:hypothetical protein
MPKKNSIDIPQDKILMVREDLKGPPTLAEEELTPEETLPQVVTKPKRQISDAQREHLNNIRAKALEKKAEMKEETLKAKLAKTIEKKELVKKYDEYTQEKEKEEVKKDIVKPKKEKKIVYKLADSSSSSSSDDEDEKVVYVKKIKDKSKKQIYHKQENNDRHNDSLDSTLYKSSQEILHKRAIEERVKANLIRWNNAMMPQEY